MAAATLLGMGRIYLTREDQRAMQLAYPDSEIGPYPEWRFQERGRS